MISISLYVDDSGGLLNLVFDLKGITEEDVMFVSNREKLNVRRVFLYFIRY